MDPALLDLPPGPGALAAALKERQPIDFKAPEPKVNMDWTNTDTMLQAGVGVGLLLDYLQTRKIVKDGTEANPIIGNRGQRVRPEIYFPATFLASALAAKYLPPDWRHALQGGLIGLQGSTVYHNWADFGRNPFR